MGAGTQAREGDPAAAPDDIPVRPAMPEFDWGFEAYESRLAAYSPTPLPVRLLVLASEYDGRDWVRLSGDADLLELPGRHFDLVTSRINDLARSLSSWLAGNTADRLERPPSRRSHGRRNVPDGFEPSGAGSIAPRPRRKPDAGHWRGEIRILAAPFEAVIQSRSQMRQRDARKFGPRGG